MTATDAGNYLAELVAVGSREPEQTAIIDETRSVSYRQLLDEVQGRAEALAAAGVRPGDRIALVAENSASFLISALAVWSAQATLASVYPSTGHADLSYTLDNADPVLVLTDRHSAPSVRDAIGAHLQVALIDEERFHVPGVATGRMANPAGLGEDVFLICYSSGTTSRPKAIMLSQSALYNGARTYADVWRLTSSDRTIVCLPMAWLYGLDSTSMATLLVGGTVISRRRARPEVIVEAIEKHHASFLPAVTTVFTKLVEYLASTTDHHDLTSLRLAVSGGEPRNEGSFAEFTRATGVAVHDTFCASECFPLITYDPVADPVPVRGSAGKLVPHSELKILNPHGEPVETGQVGEAFTRGRGLMLGYWRDPDQTAQALTEDGWYRTKDLVRMDEDGYVYVVGRLSDMIIRGGSNVSPAEVERAIREEDGIRDAAVVGIPDPIYGEAVVAAVVLAAGVKLDVDQLRARLANQLAAFKVPTEFLVLDQLPSNATTGKLDRREIRALATKEGAAP